ncbi:XRE family transcriptional regulator [Dysgonomonas sp. BGC7]|uniref:LexA family transcriptional regulator n=1 Tax=Dysgonomonas sp. BGC7 TaxID=1658008 RepID=UPI0006804753|nr:XRE family transcriptional regulator [Dysgonomonas sp. BGC7]MBD8390100.1 helix-turn-helix domain-containing protein [Dysgonomonas sp. BGC7]
MEFKDRLKFLLEKDGVTAYRIWKDTAITKGTIANYIEGKTKPNKSNISILASYFNVSEEWLATGSGKMSRSNKIKGEEPFVVTKSGVKYYEMANGRYRMRVPFIPVKAYAKYIDECRDAEILDEEFEEFDFIVDKIGHGRYFAFEIKGDSMDNDTKRSLSNGDIVLARELNKEHWRNKLHTEDFPNWIIVLDNTILCKQISNQDVEKGTIMCHSLNSSPEYSDFELKLDDVGQLLNIIQKVSSVF